MVSLGTLASRVLGLIRDISIAYFFGAAWVSDVFFAAYRIPSLFRKLLAEGALSSAVVPVYTSLEDSDPEKAARLVRAAFTWVLILVGGFVLFGMIFSRYFVMVAAPGFIGQWYFPLTVSLTRVMFPFLLLMSLASVVMGVLHAHKKFAVPAFAPCFFNLSLIASIFLLAPRLGLEPEQQIWALAVGVLVGGLLQFLVQWLRLRGLGIQLGWLPDWRLEGLTRLLKLMGPMAFGLAIMQLIVLVDTIVASYLVEGSISHLYYSNRLFQFPFALIGVAVGTVVLPTSSQQVVKENGEEVLATTRNSLGMMSFLMIPSAFGLWLLGHPLIGLLFRRGEFSAADQRVTFAVLFTALFGLFAYGCNRIFISICYSYEDTKGPVLAALLALLVNGSLNVGFVLLWPHIFERFALLQRLLPRFLEYRVSALTLAGSAAVWLQVFFLRTWLGRYLPAELTFPWRQFGKHLFLALLMSVALFPILYLPLDEFTTVATGVVVGALVYFALAHLLGETYPARILTRLKNKLTTG